MAKGHHVSADLGVMGSVSKQFVTNYEGLRQAINHLQQETEIHSHTWNGQTKQAFTGAMSNVNIAWDKLNTLLDQTAANINTSANAYGSTDETHAGNIRGVDTTGITTALTGH